VYQPIVDLQTREIVAYEALARGADGESPQAMFQAARDDGTLSQLDWACRWSAMRGALAARLSKDVPLFVNIEPEVVGTEPPAHLLADLTRAGRRLSVFFEITERAITDRPAELLRVIDELRSNGMGVALDDVGVDPHSLALLPVLRPDVIKLDMSLVKDATAAQSSAVMNAVCAHAESTGAVILAEGVETEEHVLIARTLGATLAQGWHFGRPGPLPAKAAGHRPGTRRLAVPKGVVHRSPFELAAASKSSRTGAKDLLIAVSRRLEEHAAELGQECVVVSAFQDAQFFTPATRSIYASLAGEAALVAALGVGLPAEPAPGVRGTSLSPVDPLTGEWDVAVIGPHFAAALVARELGDRGPEAKRRFEFVLTFERELVVDTVQSLLSRVNPRSVRGSQQPDVEWPLSAAVALQV
jgi:EAL domain-containing protein (putative c-di-GMP-specific phosphodiesterase class I)